MSKVILILICLLTYAASLCELMKVKDTTFDMGGVEIVAVLLLVESG